VIDNLPTARYGMSVAVFPMYSSFADWKNVETGGNRIPTVGPEEDDVAATALETGAKAGTNNKIEDAVNTTSRARAPSFVLTEEEEF
jgi:hypothetical protein